MRVLVSDDLSAEGVEILRRGPGIEVDVKVGLKPDELKAIIGDYEGLVVRSATKVTADVLAAATKLRAIGRAGSGVDNIDVPAATRKGVVVMNTPGGNTITVAELTVSMMLALARHLPQATASTKSGKWEKKKFQGRELNGKTLGLVGAGNIGGAVAKRCIGFGMKVLAYDPFLTPEGAARLGVELASLDDITEKSDVISLHVPATAETKGLFNAARIARMKKGAFLVNCARGGLVDEAAVAEALKSGQLGGAAFDVFEKEPPAADNPLLACDNFICTPHIGASTEEAQSNVALAIADQLVDFLTTGTIRNAVNVPAVSPELREAVAPQLLLAEKLGSLAGQLRPPAVAEVELEVVGDDVPAEAMEALTTAALKGLLSRQVEGDVNEVNAPFIAKDRGIRVTQKRASSARDYTSLLTIRVKGPQGARSVAGSYFGRSPRIVQIDRFSIDAAAEGHMLAINNVDKPGVIGSIGLALGEGGVNIAQFHLGRAEVGGDAFALITVDADPSGDVLAKLRALPHVKDVTPIEL